METNLDTHRGDDSSQVLSPFLGIQQWIFRQPVSMRYLVATLKTKKTFSSRLDKIKRSYKPVVVHTFNPNTWEAEAGGSVSSKPAWSIK